MFQSSTLAAIYRFLATMWKLNSAISLMILFSLLGIIGAAHALAHDGALINGELLWIKPLKFSISFVLYGASLIFISQFLIGSKRLLRVTSIAALTGSIIELGAISMQASRAVPSATVFDSPVDSALWFAVKLAIMPVAFAIVAMFCLLLKQANLPRVLGSSICWAALLSIVGFIPGLLMLLPESMQHAFAAQSLAPGLSHVVSTVPYLGWSKSGGDLRVAHFVGLHALQILPLIGYAISKCCASLSLRRQTSLVSISGFTYFGIIILLTAQALTGQSAFVISLQFEHAYAAIFVSAITAAAITVFPSDPILLYLNWLRIGRAKLNLRTLF